MSQLLGYRHEELLGKELWEIGLLKDEQASQATYRELQSTGQVRRFAAGIQVGREAGSGNRGQPLR
jgi:hypothetical protein